MFKQFFAIFETDYHDDEIKLILSNNNSIPIKGCSGMATDA